MSESNANTSGVGIDEIVVERDDQGNRVPEEVYVEEFDDTVVSRPMNNAGQEKYITPLVEAASAAKAVADEEIAVEDLNDEQRGELEELGQDALSSEKLAEMFEEHIVDPDLVEAYQQNYPNEDIDGLDKRFVDKDLKVGAKDGLFFAVLIASDMGELVDAFRGAVDEGEEGNET